jgi:ankyrin repeat protein
VEALVQAGCDVRIKDNDGNTGLQIAKAAGHTAVRREAWTLDRA